MVRCLFAAMLIIVIGPLLHFLWPGAPAALPGYWTQLLIQVSFMLAFDLIVQWDLGAARTPFTSCCRRRMNDVVTRHMNNVVTRCSDCVSERVLGHQPQSRLFTPHKRDQSANRRDQPFLRRKGCITFQSYKTKLGNCTFIEKVIKIKAWRLPLSSVKILCSITSIFD